jgi:hypothetical protein
MFFDFFEAQQSGTEVFRRDEDLQTEEYLPL